MGIEAFLRHLDDPSPGFRCTKAGAEDGSVRFVAKVSNPRNAPADKKALAELSRHLGPAAQTFEGLYHESDGLVLYAQTDIRQRSYDPPYPAGLRFFPVKDWSRRTEEARDWIDALLFDDEESEDWMKSGLAFAEMCHSGNYFLVQPDGPHAGKIYFQDHDCLWDWEEPLAQDLDGFLDLIQTDPAGFLYRMGCSTRSCDGRSQDQWVPETYIPDA